MRHIKFILTGALIFAIILAGVFIVLGTGWALFGPMGAPIVGLSALALFCCWVFGLLYFEG